MAIKVGINGFGRIGRVALRIMVERGSATYQMCGINLRNADLDYMVYQVSYTCDPSTIEAKSLELI